MKDMFSPWPRWKTAPADLQEMRKGLSDQERGGTTFDPEGEATLYLQALADSKGFEGMISPTQKLTGGNAAAVDRNRHRRENPCCSRRAQDLMATEASREKVEGVIREEVRHAADLRVPSTRPRGHASPGNLHGCIDTTSGSPAMLNCGWQWPGQQDRAGKGRI
jgi:hypothetical protein